MSKNKCSFHSLIFIMLFYKLKSPGVTSTTPIAKQITLASNRTLHMSFPFVIFLTGWLAGWLAFQLTRQRFQLHCRLKQNNFSTQNNYTSKAYITHHSHPDLGILSSL